MVEKTLESDYNSPDPLKIKVRTGTVYTIHPHHVHFFEKLRDLPVAAKIEMLGLTTKEMSVYISNEKIKLQGEVGFLLNKKWYWKDTGDVVDITPDTIPEVPLTLAQMQSKVRSIETLAKIKEFFTGDNREVYCKED